MTICKKSRPMKLNGIGNALHSMMLLLGIFSCASGHHDPFTEKPPEKRYLAAIENRLRGAVAALPHLTIKEFGRIKYAEFNAGLWIIRYQPSGAAVKRVLISAGIHGNEPAATAAAVRLVDTLSGTPESVDGVAIEVVPIVNPWGWVHDIRYNQRGIDINRDFATFDTQEAKLIRQFLRDSSYDLMVDLHEDPTAFGFYLYQYGLGSKSVSRNIVGAVQSMGYPIETDVRMIILKTQSGIIDAPMWGLWYMRLTGQLSITNYYRLNNSRFVYTVETPTDLPWEDRLKIQQTALTMLLETYTGNQLS